MKKIFTAIVLVLTALSASSQVEAGIFAGPQMTSVKYTIDGAQQKDRSKYGFQAGVALKVPFEGNLFFAPMAFYSMKGYKVTFDRFVYPPDVNATDNDVSMHTFELAALLQWDLGKKPSHFFIKAGPSLDFQLFGKEKFNLNGSGSVDRSIKFSPADYGHYAANLLTHFGFESASGFMVFAQYSYGVGSINNKDLGPRIRHRAFGISIGKYFNKKKIVLDTRNIE
jgi:hypothetical protein